MKQSDHERVTTSGAWTGAIAGMLGLMAVDWRVAQWAAFMLNWTVILATCYLIARYKRRWYGWAAFWALTAACLISGILGLVGLMGGKYPSTAALLIGGVTVFIYYWLIRMPRLRPAVQTAAKVIRHEHNVVHVHHVVIRGQQVPQWTATQVSPGAARPLPQAPARRVITRAARRARGHLPGAPRARARTGR